MSLVAFLGAVEIGFVFGLVALGVFLSFRVLNFPDLTVDGSFPLGASVAAALIVHGIDPYAATAVAIAAGAVAGLLTAFLNLRFGILHLLASILTMIALYSINLRIMGRPNVGVARRRDDPHAVPGPRALPTFILKPLFAGVVLVFVGLLLTRFCSRPTAWRCGRPAAIRAWPGPRASTPRPRPMSAWRSATRWWLWPELCSPR
jgi:putative ABC transport system permease protein